MSAFTISEGRQSVIAGITIEGNDKVSDQLVRRQIQLTTAQPLDLSALARSRRNLYDTGAFSVVDITRRRSRGRCAGESAGARASADERVEHRRRTGESTEAGRDQRASP